MEIFIDKKRSRYGMRHKLVFVRVSPVQALDLIRSLTAQMCEGNSNGPRSEYYDKNGTYFSIAVENAAAVRDYDSAISAKKALDEYREKMNEAVYAKNPLKALREIDMSKKPKTKKAKAK